jgi:phage terminase large subunit
MSLLVPLLEFNLDENWRAEGYHQREGSPVLLIIDEGKAVADAVYESFDKCTPTFKLVASSAGPASGRFHRYFSSESAYWFRRKVTYLECPHMSDQQRLADLEIYGEHSTFYRNRWLSEFATDSGESVISLDALRECIAHPPAWVD